MADARKIIVYLLAWGIGGVFAYASALKFMNPAVFLADIESYRLVPYRIAWLGAALIPSLELVCGVALFFRMVRREAAMILWLLTVVFMVVLASAWWRGIDVSCGCFGASGQPATYSLSIGRDLLLWVGLGTVFVMTRQKRPPGSTEREH